MAKILITLKLQQFFYIFKNHSYALTYKPHFKGIFSFFKYFKFNMGSFGCL